MVDTRRGLLDDTILEASGQITASNGQVIENKVFTDLKGDAGTVGYHILIPSGVHTVTIRNCRFIGGSVDPGFFYLGAAVRIRDGCYDVLVENCEFIDTPRMVHAHYCTGGIVTQANVMDSNYATQAVQYANCIGQGFRIAYNDIICGMQRWSTGTHRDQTMQDFISCFATSGDTEDQLLIVGNRVEGRNNLVTDPQASDGAGVGGDYSVIGGGIVMGDGGEGARGYCTARSNYLVNPAISGITVGGGDYQRLEDNWVWGDGNVNEWSIGGGIYWFGWGGAVCPEFAHESGTVVYYRNVWDQNTAWGKQAECTGPVTTAPFYTDTPGLTAQGVRDQWTADIDSIMESEGRFYPSGTSAAPLPDGGGGPGPEYVPGQDVVTRRVVRVRGRGVRLRPWSDSWKV